LGADFEFDVAIPSAEESGVYPFLQIDIGGMSLLEALRSGDVDALYALHEDEAEARQLRADLLSFLAPKQTEPASHTRAKQVYWCVDEDPEAGGFIYHLLAPLYPSSLVHAVYKAVESAYGKESLSVRQSRRDKKYHSGTVHEYPHLAIHNLVASNAQNISALSGKRRGKSYLLSSAPPHWKSSELRIPYHCNTVFDRIYGGKPEVRETVSALLNFLAENPPQKQEVRRRREAYVSTLIGELIQMAAKYQHGLAPAWSKDSKVELNEDERLWLDPYRARIPEEVEFRQSWMQMEWVDQIGSRFARWLNAHLEDRLPVGDVEFLQWRRELLQMDIMSSWERQLYKELGATLHQSVEEVEL